MLTRRDERTSLGARSLCRACSSLVSVLAHLTVFALLLISAYRRPVVAPSRLPGTHAGTTLLTYYGPGSLRASALQDAAHNRRTKVVTTKAAQLKTKTAPIGREQPHADAGPGSSAESGIGEGDIRIALLQRFPTPRPDLSVMAHGAKGDVVLDAVIDKDGHVAELTLLHGLAPSIDETVLATVKGWLFTPATRNGLPVVSEQEFHFHYERG